MRTDARNSLDQFPKVVRKIELRRAGSGEDAYFNTWLESFFYKLLRSVLRLIQIICVLLVLGVDVVDIERDKS